MKGNGVVAERLFLISVYEFPLLLIYYLLNYYSYSYNSPYYYYLSYLLPNRF